jgi:uncharacterized protein (AIM24 family)
MSYPPPPSQGSPGMAMNYPPPPAQGSPGQAVNYPPPPSQQTQPAMNRPGSYPPPPQHTPSPQLSQSPVPSYPGPPPQQHDSARNSQQLAMRPAPASDSQQFSPPPESQQQVFSPPPFEGRGPLPDDSYPPEKQEPRDPAPTVDTSKAMNLVSGAPPAGHFVGAQATGDDIGTFNGGSYRISHRDSNTILTIQLAIGCPLQARPGSMIAMSHTMTLKGTVKFSMKKMVANSDIATSTYTGPGELLLAPYALGDITSIRLTGKEFWSVGSDAYLASTQGVIKDYKRQGLSKAMFSGEGLWVAKISGTGILWISSFGAIIRKDVSLCIAGQSRLVLEPFPLILFAAYRRREVHRGQRTPRCVEQ